MASITITLNDLLFPANLEDKFCKFRVVVSLRYKDAAGKIAYARQALPGLGKDDYWECELDNKNKDNYVRHPTEPKVDMDAVDVSLREVLFSDLEFQKLERVEVEILDIEKKDGFWNKLLETVIKVAPQVAMQFIPANVPLTLMLLKGAIEKGTGKKVQDLEKEVLEAALGKKDGMARRLLLKSATLNEPPQDSFAIAGKGVQGNYQADFSLLVED